MPDTAGNNHRVFRRAKPEGEERMTPTNGTKKTTRTVFDFATFDKVDLVKEFTLPAKPTTTQEALAAVGHDTSKLLDIIYKGLVAEAQDSAYNDLTGFRLVNEDGEPGDVYEGKCADTDGDRMKQINGAVLNIAKMFGYSQSLSKEQKREIKEKAMQSLRNMPEVMKTIQG
jgi:hypothetical protein